MRRPKPPLPKGNKIDLADDSQIRILRRRLGVSSDDLHRVVAKVGNSITAVTKEIELQKPLPSAVSARVEIGLAAPPATVVPASV
jgi:hypothetical protein